MKKTIILTSLFIASIFIACSDDDGNIDPVVGKWQQIEIQNQESEITTCQELETLEFKNDGTLILTEFLASETNIENCEGPVTTNFEWSEDGDTNAFDIIETSTGSAYRITIFIIDGELTIQSNDLFREEGVTTTIIKVYRSI